MAVRLNSIAIASTVLPLSTLALLSSDFILPPPHSSATPCPCDDPSLCVVVSTHRERELFGFGADNFGQGNADWSAITTIAWGKGTDIVCEAHRHGVRVVAGVSPPVTGGQKDIDDFVNATVTSLQQNFYDGVTFDFEGPVNGYDDPVNQFYVNVVRQTSLALKSINPHYQISVCAAWSPFGIDKRWYDYKALAFAVDFLYVMCYDVRSQIFDQCVASANAPLPLCRKGITDYLNIGIPPSKLVLGLPWYGYEYECIGDFDLRKGRTCEIAQKPFQGVNCSDAAGSERSYAEIRGIVNRGENASVVWRDPYLNVPYFNYRGENSKNYQIWYDDPDSLKPVYRLVNEFHLRGSGPYRWDDLDLTNNPVESFQMFDALKTTIKDEQRIRGEDMIGVS